MSCCHTSEENKEEFGTKLGIKPLIGIDCRFNGNLIITRFTTAVFPSQPLKLQFTLMCGQTHQSANPRVQGDICAR